MSATSSPTSPADVTPKRRVLAFYRQDQPGMGRKLAIAATLISLGGLSTLLGGLSLQLGVSDSVRTISSTLGSALLFAGLILGFVMFPRSLRHEGALSVEHQGLRFIGDGGEAELLPWDDILRIDADELALHVHLRHDPVRHVAQRFGGKSHRELATLLDACRRKAQFSLLR